LCCLVFFSYQFMTVCFPPLIFTSRALRSQTFSCFNLYQIFYLRFELGPPFCSTDNVYMLSSPRSPGYLQEIPFRGPFPLWQSPCSPFSMEQRPPHPSQRKASRTWKRSHSTKTLLTAPRPFLLKFAQQLVSSLPHSAIFFALRAFPNRCQFCVEVLVQASILN